jgi:hypothetical protein
LCPGEGGGTLACGREGGKVPIRTKGQKLWYSSISKTVAYDTESG